MRITAITLAVVTAVAGISSAHAETASTSPTVASSVAPRAGGQLATADGRRLGKISRVINDASGQPAYASIIFDSRFVNVPVSTISAKDELFVTSLSRTELRKLK